MLNPLIYINFHGLLQLSAGSGEVGDACAIMPTESGGMTTESGVVSTESGVSQLASEYLTIFPIQCMLYSQVMYVNKIVLSHRLTILAYNFNCMKLIILNFLSFCN